MSKYSTLLAFVNGIQDWIICKNTKIKREVNNRNEIGEWKILRQTHCNTGIRFSKVRGNKRKSKGIIFLENKEYFVIEPKQNLSYKRHKTMNGVPEPDLRTAKIQKTRINFTPKTILIEPL